MNTHSSHTDPMACPRCGKAFECRASGIDACDCTKVVLTEEDRITLSLQYEGCLCMNCLNELKKKTL